MSSLTEIVATSPGDPTSTPELFTMTGTSSPSASATDGGGGGISGDRTSGNGDGSTSPLLFFVALGFGVVFTNLWIIVGVKYCFRYNARNRQMRMAEDGDPVAMENMNPRPHRRRREKKLMTMDEVNAKFPMMKYKNWVASRAQEGLPTMGGVSQPPSRANSVRSLEAIAPELPSKEERSSDEHRPATSPSAPNAASERDAGNDNSNDTMRKEDALNSSAATGEASNATSTQPPNLQRVESDDDHDDERIETALPPECVGTTGDACAICIEPLEDDDDIRGLTCGHAFHAGCLDPWLTSRRACCPLCKADYYTPKPRPQPLDANGNPIDPAALTEMRRTNSRMNLPQTPPSAWYNIRGRGIRLLPNSIRTQRPQPQRTQRRTDASRRTQPQSQPQSPAAPTSTTQQNNNGGEQQRRRFLPEIRIPNVRLPYLPSFGRNRNQTPPAPTPSQLEAGRPPVVSS